MRPALLLALAAAAVPACGLVPSGEAMSPFPGDGVQGFGAAEPIEVCLGTARVMPPSSAAGAVCVAEGATAKACSADAECTGIERCLCGRCIVEPCQGTGCGEGLVCRDKRCTRPCTADAECGQGEVCVSGGCARGCAGDGDCHFGERCDALGNTCRAKLCGEATPCGAGARCEAAAVEGDLREPEVVTIGGREVAYVELRAGGQPAIFRARVEGRTRWTIDPITPVIPASSAPSALVDGDRVELYFGSSQVIMHAVSTDGGVTFAFEDTPVLVPELAWEAGYVGSPAVIRYLDRTYLFYEGGSRAGIGVAEVVDGVATRLGDGPVMTPKGITDPLFWRDVRQLSAPMAVVSGDALRLYFTARGVEGLPTRIDGVDTPAAPNDSIGLAATLDMKRFELHPTGPVLARLTNLRTYLGEREASVRLSADGAAEITFVAADASGSSPSGLYRAR